MRLRVKEAIKVLKSLADITTGSKSHYIYSDQDVVDAIGLAITALEKMEAGTLEPETFTGVKRTRTNGFL